jgi:hypothetical protein
VNCAAKGESSDGLAPIQAATEFVNSLNMLIRKGKRAREWA